MNIEISGMHCQACVRRVQAAIAKVNGATAEKVDIGSAVVAVDPSRQAEVLEAIHKAGYEARVS